MHLYSIISSHHSFRELCTGFRFQCSEGVQQRNSLKKKKNHNLVCFGTIPTHSMKANIKFTPLVQEKPTYMNARKNYSKCFSSKKYVHCVFIVLKQEYLTKQFLQNPISETTFKAFIKRIYCTRVSKYLWTSTALTTRDPFCLKWEQKAE